MTDAVKDALRPFAEMAKWVDDTSVRRDAIYCGGVPGLKCEVTYADYHAASRALAALEQAGEPVDRKKRMDALWKVLREYRLEDGKTVAELIKSGHDRISILAGLADASGEVIALQLDRKVGMHGSAYDPPGPCRAYTYEHQPSNLPAYSLGQAHAAASAMSAGDNIDRGLGLLKALEEQGFGVFEIEQGGARDD